MKPLFLLLLSLVISFAIKGQVAKNIEVTSGNLSTTLTAEELSTVTHLTLTGTIDARDFRTMRNAMPVLSVLDISGVTITGYNLLYPPNTVPGLPFDVPYAESYALIEKTTLTSVTLPATVKEIGQYAFMSCSNLSSINLPEGLQSIGRAAFILCTSLTSIKLPTSLTTMGWQVFDRCSSLTSVLLPPDMKVIETATFADCVSLESIDIPSTVTHIDGGAFMGCKNLQSLELPPSLESMGDKCFYRCTSLRSVVLPFFVTSIWNEAFYECTQLTTINIPRNVKTIGQRAFYGCTSLASIYSYMVQPADLGPDFVQVFGKVDQSKCVLYVPEGSGELYARASQWRDFSTITEMPGIKFSATTITMANNESTAFLDITTGSDWQAETDQSWLTLEPLSGTGSQRITLSALENVSLTSRIALVMFFGPDSIQYEITVVQKGLAVNVQTEAPGTILQHLTLQQLNTLSELVITGPMDARDFRVIRDRMPLLETLDLRGASILAYKGSGGTFPYISPWEYAADQLPEMAFGDGSTSRISNIATLYLPETCTSIAREALSHCKGLTEVIIPPSVVNIGFMAFGYCSNLKSVRLPSVTTIAPQAFVGCISMTDIHMPLVTDIGVQAFESCSKLTSVVLPASLTKIHEKTFYMCFDLMSIELSSSLTIIEREAFFECNNLRSITIPHSVRSIGFAAFAFCRKLATISIPASVESIGANAFSYCDSLKTVYSYRAVPVDLRNPSSVFSETNINSSTLYVPAGSKALYASANGWKDFFKIVEMEDFDLSATTALLDEREGSDVVIHISGNAACTASSDQPWLLVTQQMENGKQSLHLKAQANTGALSRTATVTVSAPGKESKTIKVTQPGLTVGVQEMKANAEIKYYPSPFTQQMTIEIANPLLEKVTVEINSISGQKIKILARAQKVANISLVWDGSDENGQKVLPGVYLLKMNGQVRKVVKR